MCIVAYVLKVTKVAINNVMETYNNVNVHTDRIGVRIETKIKIIDYFCIRALRNTIVEIKY